MFPLSSSPIQPQLYPLLRLDLGSKKKRKGETEIEKLTGRSLAALASSPNSDQVRARLKPQRVPPCSLSTPKIGAGAQGYLGFRSPAICSFFPREERHLRLVDPSLPLPSLARGPLDWEEEGASEAEIEVEG